MYRFGTIDLSSRTIRDIFFNQMKKTTEDTIRHDSRRWLN